MKEFIIISGTQNSGKTTAAWVVYQRLLPYATHLQLYICGSLVSNHGEIVYKPIPYNDQPEDFKAILDLPGYKVALISGGDDDELLEAEIDSVYNDVDFIVISLRTSTRPGSSRHMVITKYPKDYTREFFTPAFKHHLTHPMDIVNDKRLLGDKIVNYILVQTTYRDLL